MNENLVCNCCYNTGNLVKKCEFEHHQICNNCNKEYTLRFRRRNCMFCNPHEEKYTSYNSVRSSRRLSDNDLYFILFCNIFLTIAMFAFIFLIFTIIIKITVTLKDLILSEDFLNIYYINYCSNIDNNNFDELLYCNL
jgi:hypothetical protein